MAGWLLLTRFIERAPLPTLHTPHAWLPAHLLQGIHYARSTLQHGDRGQKVSVPGPRLALLLR